MTQTIINAKSEAELAMRIHELEKRGWEVFKLPEPEHKENKHFSYNDTKKGNKRTYRGSEGYTKYRAIMRKEHH